MSKIKIETKINAPISTVYQVNSIAKHLKRWNYASPGWYNPDATIDFRVGGNFVVKYGSDDGKNDFDLGGKYTLIENNKVIEYLMGDDRLVRIDFEDLEDKTKVVLEFDAENENPLEMQKEGWSNILDNMKLYSEKISNQDYAYLEKEILIQTTQQKLWNVLTNPELYKQWSKVWDEYSRMECDELKIGNKIRFLGSEGWGMESVIRVFRPYDAITYIVENDIKNNEISPSTWAEFEETYLIDEFGDQVKLRIFVECTKATQDMMSQKWDEALSIISALSQN